MDVLVELAPFAQRRISKASDQNGGLTVPPSHDWKVSPLLTREKTSPTESTNVPREDVHPSGFALTQDHQSLPQWVHSVNWWGTCHFLLIRLEHRWCVFSHSRCSDRDLRRKPKQHAEGSLQTKNRRRITRSGNCRKGKKMPADPPMAWAKTARSTKSSKSSKSSKNLRPIELKTG